MVQLALQGPVLVAPAHWLQPQAFPSSLINSNPWARKHPQHSQQLHSTPITTNSNSHSTNSNSTNSNSTNSSSHKAKANKRSGEGGVRKTSRR